MNTAIIGDRIKFCLNLYINTPYIKYQIHNSYYVYKKHIIDL